VSGLRRRILIPPCGSSLMMTTNSVPLPVSELKASSEMMREDPGDASIRSSASGGMVIRSSAALAPPVSVEDRSVFGPPRPGDSSVPCPPFKETTLHRMSSPPARSMAVKT